MLHILAIAAAAVAANQAPDRPNPSSEEPTHEIIVTGERADRSLLETPSSVVVFTADRIEALAAPDRFEQVLELVPNVQFGTSGQGPTIRGQDTTGALFDLPAFLGGSRPRVTLQIDGRAAGHNEFIFGIAPLWDVKQVEVFRSPQTTTQGRNAIAGAIVINSNDPSFTPERRARAIHGDLSTWQGSAMVSGPIVDDQLAFRLAADYRRSRPSTDIGDNMRGADPDLDRFGLVRARLLAKPSALPGLSLLATFVHSDARMPQVEFAAVPFRERRDPDATYGVWDVNVDSATLEARQAIGTDTEIVAILSTGDARSRRYAPPGLGEAHLKARDHSAEAFGHWKPGGPVSVRGGVHLLSNRLDQHIDLSTLRRGIGTFDDRQRSLGLWAEADVEPASRLTLTLGGRYQEDRQRRSGALVGPEIVPLDFDGRFHAFLPKISAAYRLSDRIVAGILVQKAYNPGGGTLIPELGEVDRFGAERLWNFEAFARGDLARGVLSFSANLFHNSIRDAQRPFTTSIPGPGGGPIFVTRFDNAPKATSRGAEVELTLHPSDRLTLRGAVGLLDTRLDDGPSPALEGKDFQRAPHFTGSAAVDWSPVDPLRLSAQLRHHSAYFSNDANTPELRIGKATLVDARAAYAIGPVTAFAYVRNLFDSFYLRHLFSATRAQLEEPREFGVGLVARF